MTLEARGQRHAFLHKRSGETVLHVRLLNKRRSGGSGVSVMWLSTEEKALAMSGDRSFASGPA